MIPPDAPLTPAQMVVFWALALVLCFVIIGLLALSGKGRGDE